MGNIDIATVFYLLQLLQPVLNGAGNLLGGALQFVFLALDLGSFWLGFL